MIRFRATSCSTANGLDDRLESAYRNDPLVDVSIVLDSLVRSRELGDFCCGRGWAAGLTRACMPGSKWFAR